MPAHLATPAGELRANGHDVVCVDLAVDDWDPSVLDGVDRVAISATMHTAMRLRACLFWGKNTRRDALQRAP